EIPVVGPTAQDEPNDYPYVPPLMESENEVNVIQEESSLPPYFKEEQGYGEGEPPTERENEKVIDVSEWSQTLILAVKEKMAVVLPLVAQGMRGVGGALQSGAQNSKPAAQRFMQVARQMI